MSFPKLAGHCQQLNYVRHMWSSSAISPSRTKHVYVIARDDYNKS